MAIARLNLTGDYGLAAHGVVFDPVTLTAIGTAVASAASAAAASAGTIGTVATLAGGAITAMGAIQAGQAAKQNADYQAAQMRQQGVQAMASSQRQMFDAQRKTQFTQSTLQANAAASGAGAQDPTVVKLGEDIAGRGEEQALMDLYNGQNTKAGLDDSATAKELSGDAAQTGSYYSAAGSLLSSAGQGFGKYAYRTQ